MRLEILLVLALNALLAPLASASDTAKLDSDDADFLWGTKIPISMQDGILSVAGRAPAPAAVKRTESGSRTGESAASFAQTVKGKPAPSGKPLTSGIDKIAFDESTRAQDDFYRYVNGGWYTSTEIPADKPVISNGTEQFEIVVGRLHAILRQVVATPISADADTRRAGNLYASFLDQARAEELGAAPILPLFARINAIKDKSGLARVLAEFTRELSHGDIYRPAPTTPIVLSVHQDNRNSSKYIVDLVQNGLGLPDRDYYLDDRDTKLKGIRDAYRKHVRETLALAGDRDAEGEADDVLVLETRIAAAQWSGVQSRDPIKAYNQYPIEDVAKLAPGFDWSTFFDAGGIAGKVRTVNVSQPSFLTAFARLATDTPLPIWRAYLRWHVLQDNARYLSKKFVDGDFAFYGTTLRGTPENEPRWERGVHLVESSMGEALGKLYVTQYFPSENKVRVQKLVWDLVGAFSVSIDKLDWMSNATKREAHAKLAKVRTKIGYPDQWRDYSALQIRRDDLLGNVLRANTFEYERNLAKLGKPVDHGEWQMTPQSVDGYYNPESNEIVFPAGLLQPSMFDASADDAVNYGAIGSFIGHELSHAFDDEGSRYDGDGNLRDWWAAVDHERFASKTRQLVAQYSAYEPLPGYHLNGERTLGENIADNSGVAMAYRAYHISLGDQPAPMLDGLTGDQRFYIGFAHMWRSKWRDNRAIERIKAAVWSMPEYRVTGSVVNDPHFYAAFDVKAGDKMYVAPERRVQIW